MKPRFGLKTLIWLMTALAVCFASYGYFGAHITAVLGLLALAIAAHVVGNAMGTRLREMGSRRSEPGAETVRNPMANGGVEDADFAPVTRLRHRSSLGRPLAIVTLCGATLAGVLGGMLFLRLMDPPILLSNAVLGFVAAAVLGGIWTFAAASFLQVAGGALWQATRESKK